MFSIDDYENFVGIRLGGTDGIIDAAHYKHKDDRVGQM